jgi:NAD(P)-dependent dehydrogenase (short-subunit alcohol dehydrogenase family)
MNKPYHANMTLDVRNWVLDWLMTQRARTAQRLAGAVALVAGATRGAGRGIAVALGEAGATVYCTGRSSGGHAATPGRPETIEETAELVSTAGGRGIAVRVDHTEPAEVKKLAGSIRRRHKGLDILVNDIWGGDALTEFGKPFWSVSLDNGLGMLKQAIHSHIITAHYAVPLMLGRRRALFSKSRTATDFITAATSSMTW